MRHKNVQSITVAVCVLLLVLVPFFVDASSHGGTTPKALRDFIERLGFVISSITAIVSAAALLFFVYGLVKFIAAGSGAMGGDEKGKTDGKKSMLWSIIAIFVMVSIWGIVTLLQSVFITDELDEQKSPPCLSSSFFGDCS